MLHASRVCGSASRKLRGDWRNKNGFGACLSCLLLKKILKTASEWSCPNQRKWRMAIHFCSVEHCELLVSGSSADQWFRELPSFVSVWISGCFGNGLGRLASLHDLLSATDRSGDGVCLFPFVFALYGNKGFDPVGHRLCESSVRMYSALNHLEST